MATLVPTPEQSEGNVRESAQRQWHSINSWWVQAADERLPRESIDIEGICAQINADPIMREVLERLGQ